METVTVEAVVGNQAIVRFGGDRAYVPLVNIRVIPAVGATLKVIHDTQGNAFLEAA